jgi:DNA polymerase type B, organellar and viral
MMISTGLTGENGMKVEINWDNVEEEVIDTTQLPYFMRPPGIMGSRDKRTHRSEDKPFIAWDGEGITYAGSAQQAYVLLAASTGDYILAPEGQKLETLDCLELLFRVEDANPGAIHIGFGFGYDMNQIISSFSRNEIFRLSNQIRRGRMYRWRKKYGFKVHPGKMLQITRGWKGDNDYSCITIYDTYGFFNQPFIEVVRSYFPDRLDSIESGKSDRGSFRYNDMERIIRYCLSENELLVDILEKLRTDFHKANIYPSGWHGPGAIASASLRSHKIKEYMGQSPKEIRDIARYAYQSGRFEALGVGYHSSTVYEYDINSAYPSFISQLPQLSDGYWENVKEWEPGTFSVWKCHYRDKRLGRDDRYRDYRLNPLFHRDERGSISFPPATDGWYWEPEAALLTSIDYPAESDILEGWIWRDSSDGRIQPFKFVEDRYYERQELKRIHDGAERAIKLELNSIYGKFAQRVGWFQEGDRIPAYHQLEWAGFITASTRAKLYNAYRLRPNSIIAVETDAIFSVAPLEGIEIGTGLGQWELNTFDDLLYIQSGFYFAHKGRDAINSTDKIDTVQRFRGFDKSSMTFENVAEWLSSIPAQNVFDVTHQFPGEVNRFVGFRRALSSKRRGYWRSWERETRYMTIGRTGKRIHDTPCPSCRRKCGWMDAIHLLRCHPLRKYGLSTPHKIPWENIDFDENIWGEDKYLSAADGFSR